MADGYISQIALPNNTTYDLRDPQLKVYSGTCSTSGGTAIKDVDCSEAFILEKGAVLFVTFTTTNTAAVANLKLRVNNTTDSTLAKPIKHQYNATESNLPGVGYIRADQTYQFYYDGTNWVMNTDYNTNDNTLTRQQIDTSRTGQYSLLQSYYTIGTATSTTARTTYRTDNLYVEPSTGTLFATIFNGSGESLTNLNASNITGTLALTNLTKGDANTALMGKGSSTAPAYVSVSPSISITAGDGSNAPKINLTVLGVSGTTAQELTKASISVYGATKLSAAADDNTLAATAKSVYDLDVKVNNLLSVADAMVFKGTLGTSGSITTVPNGSSGQEYSAGDTYKIVTAGTYAGIVCEIGDLLIATADSISGQTAINNGHWTVAQTNIDGAVTGPTSSVDEHIAIFDSITGKIIKDSGTTIANAHVAYANNADGVAQTGISTNSNYPILFKNSANTTDENAGINFSNNVTNSATTTKPFTYNPNTGNLTVSQIKIAIKSDSYGLFPHTNNYNQIGSTSLYWYRAYINNYYGTTSNVNNWASGKNIGIPASSSAAAILGTVNFINTCAKNGTQTKTLLTADSTTDSDITLTLPSNTGTLALTTDDITGNAATATEWADAQNVKVILGTQYGNGTGQSETAINGGQTTVQTIAVDGILKVSNGGTGANSVNAYGVVYGNSSANAYDSISSNAEGQVFIGHGASGSTSAPSWYSGLLLTGAGTTASPYNATFANDVSITGDLIVTTTTKLTSNVGIGTDPDNNYLLYVDGETFFNDDTTINGDLIPTISSGNAAIQSLGTDTNLWASLFIDGTYGDEYTPIYWDDTNGKPATSIPLQYIEFTISQNNRGVTLASTAFTANSYVVQIVITDGESNLNSIITWTSSSGSIALTCDAVSGAVEGYILVARGGNIQSTITATQITPPSST